MARKADRKGGESRRRYHHGDLREALLLAAEQLVAEHGVDGLSVADAARLAGVSSAAPYRHFKDRSDLLGHLAARGFEELADTTRQARDQHPRGSVASLVGLGFAYLQFVAGRPGLFHLMWNQSSHGNPHPVAERCGNAAYQVFIETVERVRGTQRLEHIDPYALGTPLWSMVHGLASLSLGKSDMVNRDPDSLFELVDRATRAYIDGLRPVVVGEGSTGSVAP